MPIGMRKNVDTYQHPVNGLSLEKVLSHKLDAIEGNLLVKQEQKDALRYLRDRGSPSDRQLSEDAHNGDLSIDKVLAEDVQYLKDQGFMDGQIGTLRGFGAEAIALTRNVYDPSMFDGDDPAAKAQHYVNTFVAQFADEDSYDASTDGERVVTEPRATGMMNGLATVGTYAVVGLAGIGIGYMMLGDNAAYADDFQVRPGHDYTQGGMRDAGNLRTSPLDDIPDNSIALSGEGFLLPSDVVATGLKSDRFSPYVWISTLNDLRQYFGPGGSLNHTIVPVQGSNFSSIDVTPRGVISASGTDIIEYIYNDLLGEYEEQTPIGVTGSIGNITGITVTLQTGVILPSLGYGIFYVTDNANDGVRMVNGLPNGFFSTESVMDLISSTYNEIDTLEFVPPWINPDTNPKTFLQLMNGNLDDSFHWEMESNGLVLPTSKMCDMSVHELPLLSTGHHDSRIAVLGKYLESSPPDVWRYFVEFHSYDGNPDPPTDPFLYAMKMRSNLTLATDFDFDGNTDLDDFSWLEGCLDGPDTPITEQGCDACDLDKDNDVDLKDYSTFSSLF